MLTESPKLDKNESKQIYKNSSIISFNGREKDLKIINKDQKTHMKDWANKLLDDMYPIAEILGIDSEVLDKKKDCLTHPEKTLYRFPISELRHHLCQTQSPYQRNV